MKKCIKHLLLIGITITCPLFSISAEEYSEGIDIQELTERKVIIEESTDYDEKPFVSVEQMPYFKEGESAMLDFIKSNLKYPEQSKENGVEGRVITRFIVKKNGKIEDIQIMRSLDNLCDQEAIRIVKLMQDWVPGKQNGKNVSVYFVLPITFKADHDENSESVYKK